MKKLFVTTLISGMLVFLPIVVSAQTDPAGAACQGIQATGASCSNGESGVSSFLETVVGILLFVVGAVSVIMLIVGGIRYAISGGDAQAAASAKNTIMYAIIGIVVAFLAYAAVNYVLNQLGSSGGPVIN